MPPRRQNSRRSRTSPHFQDSPHRRRSYDLSRLLNLDESSEDDSEEVREPNELMDIEDMDVEQVLEQQTEMDMQKDKDKDKRKTWKNELSVPEECCMPNLHSLTL
jgi:hypothetical protein